MSWADEDRRWDHGADERGEPCDACGEPGCAESCLECPCGAPGRVEHAGAWLCDPCAWDAGWRPSVALELEAAE